MTSNYTSNSSYVTVGSYPSAHVVNLGCLAGQLRFNTTTQNMEVFDGTRWSEFYQQVSIGLTHVAEEAIAWAQIKMAEERELKARIERHPGLKDAWEKFQLMDLLTKEADEQSLQP